MTGPLRRAALLLFAVAAAGCALRPGGARVCSRRLCDDGVPFRIEWDTASLSRLAPSGCYARMKILRDGRYLLLYEAHDEVVLCESFDRGATWNAERALFSAHTVEGRDSLPVRVRVANPELVELANGDLICGVNYRPERDGAAPFAIVVRRSTDGGRNWLPPQVVFEAGCRFGDGCWEPAFLQLPDGRVQLYFADESPYTTSDEQRIALVESTDNGASWTTSARTVCFRPGHRDGMPVPAVCGDSIVVVIEDDAGGVFAPCVVRTSIADNWRPPVIGDSPARRRVLSAPCDGAYRGAPYAVVSPAGFCAVSYQSTRGRSVHEWRAAVPEVAIGDASAGRFAEAGQPIPIPEGHSGLWNSLLLEDSLTLILVVSSDLDGQSAPWMIRGRVWQTEDRAGRKL